jgi:hypothetical protein
MTYTSEKDRIGKEPFIAVGLVMDKCSLTAGVAPCTATQTGDAKCFNTRASCNDVPNFTKITQEIIFCEPRSNLPIGVQMFPALSGKPKKAPTSITGGKGLGNRAVVTVNINDFPHHDRGIDPYYSERTYNAESLGTFWGKFLKRNPYYEGRTLKLYYGFIGDTFSWNDFVVNEYDITDIQGPTKGKITITAKDILVRTYGQRNKYPLASEGQLVADIAASAASATLTPTGIGADYPASGYVAIGKDVKAFTRSGDVLTFTAHGQWGTQDKDHQAGDTVQLCVSWTNINVVDILYELLVTGAGITSSYIPYTNGYPLQNWDDEKVMWLSNAYATCILIKPEDVDKIIAELSEQFLFDIWWNASNQEVNIKAISPNLPGVTTNTLTEGYNILSDSMKILRDSKQRFSEIQVWYNKADFSANDDFENFNSCKINADVSRSGTDRYSQNSIKVIKSRWITDTAQASQLAGRLLARFSDTPESITFDLAVKDDDLYEIAGRVNIDSWQFQDFTGANEIRQFQVMQVDEFDAGHAVRVSGLSALFVGRYAFIAPDGTPNYSSATEDQKSRYAFVCYDTGVFLDAEPAYKII